MNVTMEVCRRAMKANQGCTVLSITTPYARWILLLCSSCLRPLLNVPSMLQLPLFRHGGAFVVPSAISKAGVENMTRSLASEWAKYGMRFNVIAPGPIPTEVIWNTSWYNLAYHICWARVVSAVGGAAGFPTHYESRFLVGVPPKSFRGLRSRTGVLCEG